MPTQQLFKFSEGNYKLPKSTLIFGLPSGYTCPGADQCKSKADRETGKITDGPNAKFRCYSASYESLYKNTRNLVWFNYDLLRSFRAYPSEIQSDMISELLYTSITRYLTKKRRTPDRITKRVRIHSSGDFYSLIYFKSWIKVAKKLDITFYAYTKCLHMWLELKSIIPENLILTASVGGRFDYLLTTDDIFKRQAHVLPNEHVANQFGFPVDHDDSYAYAKSACAFAHLVHGVQPAHSPSAIAIRDRKKNCEFVGYGKTFKSVFV